MLNNIEQRDCTESVKNMLLDAGCFGCDITTAREHCEGFADAGDDQQRAMWARAAGYAAGAYIANYWETPVCDGRETMAGPDEYAAWMSNNV